MYKEMFAANDAFMSRYNAVESFIKGLMLKGKQVGLDPEDLRSELMIKLFTLSQEYDETRGAQFTTYAITCLKREYMDIIAKKLSKKRSNGKMEYSLDYKIDSDQDGCSFQDLLAAKVDNPFDAYWQKECLAAVQKFIASFGTEDERGMIRLHYQKVKQSDIAAR